MKKNFALPAILAGFFVMGFGGIIGTVMFQIKNECTAHAEQISYLIPIFAYLWFVVISLPTGLMCGRIGRKNTVLLSLSVTAAAMVLALVANAERWWIYVVAYALIGIGNTFSPARLGWVNLLCATLLMYALGRIHGKKEALEKERLLHE